MAVRLSKRVVERLNVADNWENMLKRRIASRARVELMERINPVTSSLSGSVSRKGLSRGVRSIKPVNASQLGFLKGGNERLIGYINYSKASRKRSLTPTVAREKYESPVRFVIEWAKYPPKVKSSELSFLNLRKRYRVRSLYPRSGRQK